MKCKITLSTQLIQESPLFKKKKKKNAKLYKTSKVVPILLFLTVYILDVIRADGMHTWETSGSKNRSCRYLPSSFTLFRVFLSVFTHGVLVR